MGPFTGWAVMTANWTQAALEPSIKPIKNKGVRAGPDTADGQTQSKLACCPAHPRPPASRAAFHCPTLPELKEPLTAGRSDVRTKAWEV